MEGRNLRHRSVLKMILELARVSGCGIEENELLNFNAVKLGRRWNQETNKFFLIAHIYRSSCNRLELNPFWSFKYFLQSLIYFEVLISLQFNLKPQKVPFQHFTSPQNSRNSQPFSSSNSIPITVISCVQLDHFVHP